MEIKLVHTDNSEDVIEHFGTKGMKWGVRKAAKVQYANDKAKATTKEEKRNAKAKYKKAINPLSY